MSPAPKLRKQFYTGTEVAKLLGVTRAWIHRLARRGELEPMNPEASQGQTLIYARSEVEKLFEEYEFDEG